MALNIGSHAPCNWQLGNWKDHAAPFTFLSYKGANLLRMRIIIGKNIDSEWRAWDNIVVLMIIIITARGIAEIIEAYFYD